MDVQKRHNRRKTLSCTQLIGDIFFVLKKGFDFADLRQIQYAYIFSSVCKNARIGLSQFRHRFEQTVLVVEQTVLVVNQQFDLLAELRVFSL